MKQWGWAVHSSHQLIMLITITERQRRIEHSGSLVVVTIDLVTVEEGIRLEGGDVDVEMV